MSDILNVIVSNIARKVYENHASIREKMCIEEFERIINEQIKSGDFVQHICPASNSFALTYTPYRERERLENKLQSLEAQNKKLIETLKFMLLNSTGINDKAKFKAEETLEQVEKLNRTK